VLDGGDGTAMLKLLEDAKQTRDDWGGSK
jgi:hypothetical protein